MSEENVKTVERAIRLIDKEGARASFAQGLVAPDAEWHPPREFDGATYVGEDGFADFMASWTEDFEEWSIHLNEVRDAGDRVLAFARQEGTGNASGIDIGMDFAMLYTLRDGVITETHAYIDRAEALQAAGLSG